MKIPRQQELRLTIANEIFRIRSFCTSREIRHLSFDRQFGRHAQFKSLFTRRKSLEENADIRDTNVALAVDAHETIIGFGVLSHPDENDRWHGLGYGVMMEIKAIEVCRRFRSAGIAGHIVSMLLTHPRVEEMIVYLVGYSWTWDLDGTNQSAVQYRNMLIRLFGPHGFRELETNEPNICLKPENIFMGRIGSDVTEDIKKEFKWLRFGVSP